MAASVVRTHRVVAILGPIIPAPLTVPANVTVFPLRVMVRQAFFTFVSVVKIALAKFIPAEALLLKEEAALSMPCRTAAMGRG